VEGAPASASAKAFAIAARDRVNGPSMARATRALGRPRRRNGPRRRTLGDKTSKPEKLSVIACGDRRRQRA